MHRRMIQKKAAWSTLGRPTTHRTPPKVPQALDRMPWAREKAKPVRRTIGDRSGGMDSIRGVLDRLSFDADA